MHLHLFKISTLTFLYAATLSTNITATEDPEVARGERRYSPSEMPQRRPEQFQPYHPAAREDTRQDFNRIQERNALENEGIYNGAAVYPIDSPLPYTAPPPGNNAPGQININISPQSGSSIPQR